MAVQSPCTEQCKLDRKSGFCTGCLRTKQEIGTWHKMTDHRRHQVINERARRMAKLAK